jgi:RNase P/RNase MRP subunit p29
MVFGNLANPKLKMKANAVWPMGTNPNNRVEKFPVETTTVTQYGSILENISGRMMQSLNVTDATVASDAQVARYSATPQGVEQQRLDKTITINQYQKRIEIFFQEWANHALRSYINSMSGEIEITVDEKTRRRILDIEEASNNEAKMGLQGQIDEATMNQLSIDLDNESIVVDNKVKINFDNLSSDLLSFEVRAGSLIENERETERQNIQEMLIPVSQMIGNISDQNKDAFEQVIMQLVTRLCELSDIDISATAAQRIDQKLMAQALQATMNMVDNQQQQIGQMQQMMGLPEGGMPPEMTPGLAQGVATGAPMPQQPMPPEAMAGAGAPMPPEMMAGAGGEAMPPEMMANAPMPEAMPQEVGMPEDVMPPVNPGETGEEMVI